MPATDQDEVTVDVSSPRKISPQFPAERLTQFGVEVLADLLHLHEDRLPRTVVEECAKRGDAILDVLAQLADDGSYWRDDTSSGEWWALFHAIMILGRIPGERAGEALVAFMRRMDAAGDGNLQEWLDGAWPALLANKTQANFDALRILARDRKVDWYTRLQALDGVVAQAERRGGDEFKAAIDWTAAFAADETDDSGPATDQRNDPARFSARSSSPAAGRARAPAKPTRGSIHERGGDKVLRGRAEGAGLARAGGARGDSTNRSAFASGSSGGRKRRPGRRCTGRCVVHAGGPEGRTQRPLPLWKRQEVQEVLPGARYKLTVAPEAFTTFAQRSISDRTNCANSGGLLVSTSAPTALAFALSSSLPMNDRISVLSLATMSVGTRGGAKIRTRN